MKIRVGLTDYSIPNHNGFNISFCNLVEAEERRVLSLHDCGVAADEDILIHLVRMYLVRWAIPAVEIEHFGKLDPSLTGSVQRRFWLCMFGRAVDDLHDRDSRFFSLSDSILIATTYASLLGIEPSSAFGTDILLRTAESLKDFAVDDGPSLLDMALVRDDVCRRVFYFLSSQTVDPLASDLLRRYVGLLLGRCDLEDCLVDGASGESSTGVSRALHKAAADPEGKLHLNVELLMWYVKTQEVLSTEAKLLINDLNNFGAIYSSSIVQTSLNQWSSAINSISETLGVSALRVQGEQHDRVKRKSPGIGWKCRQP